VLLKPKLLMKNQFTSDPLIGEPKVPSNKLKIRDNVDLVGLSPLWDLLNLPLSSSTETPLKTSPNNNSSIVTKSIPDVTVV